MCKWIRKKILKVVVKAIRENGIVIGGWVVEDVEGTFTIRKV